MPNIIKHDRMKRQFMSALYNAGRKGVYYRGTYTLAYIAELTCAPVSTVRKIVKGRQ